MCAAFLPPKAPHFDGRAAVCHLVKYRNPSIAAPFAVKMWHIPRSTKSVTIRIPTLPAQIQRQTIKVWCDFLSKGGTHFKNCCILFYAYHTCTYDVLTLQKSRRGKNSPRRSEGFPHPLNAVLNICVCTIPSFISCTYVPLC